MTTLYNPFNINGVISTDKTALQNLNELCTAAGAFLTYDISQGKWAVIINRDENITLGYVRTQHTPTNNGATISTSVKKIGAGSLSFDGNNDNQTITSNTDFGFGTGDFTIEFWAYRNDQTRYETILDFRVGTGNQSAPVISFNQQQVAVYIQGANRITSGNVVTQGAWHHIAFVRSSGSSKLYLNCAQVGSTFGDTYTYISSAPLTIGSANSSAVTPYHYFGYLDEIRVSKGIARYTGSFTPSTTAFTNDSNTSLLLHYNTDFVDDAGSQIAIGVAKSYDNSNIIGNVNVSETGVSELYNSASLEFPHRSLRDQTDFVEVTIPTGDRYPNEVANTLNIQSTVINDPVQAQYLAGVELKQSRLNKIITFTTDYTSLGLKAGDLIAVTLEMYAYSNKIFRVTKVEENDGDVISVTITALEYSSDVYSTSGLVAVEKTKKTGILLKQQNEELQKADDASVAGTIGRMIAANVGLGIANNLLNKLFGRRQIGTDANGNPIYDNQTKPADDSAAEIDKLLANAKKPALTSISSASSVCAGNSVTITVACNCTSCLFDIPDFDYDYEITGVLEEDLDVLLEGKVTVSGGTGLLTIFVAADAPAGTMSVTIGGLNKTITISEVKDYTYNITKDASSITEGGTVVVSLTTTGSKLNATIPYAITGSASAKVSSPALTGTVTTINGTASLTIVTSNDSIYQGTQGLTVTFEPGLSDGCGTVGSNSTSITVLDNDTAPPANVSCNYVSVPVVWCGTFDGSTGALIGITSRASAMLPVPASGGATVMVPYACSVSGGSIVVDEEIAVAAAATNVGGQAFRVITSFDAPSNKLITGSTITLYGY